MKLCVCLYILSLMAALAPLSPNYTTLKSIISDFCAYKKSPEFTQKERARRWGHEKPFRRVRLCLHPAFTAEELEGDGLLPQWQGLCNTLPRAQEWLWKFY